MGARFEGVVWTGEATSLRGALIKFADSRGTIFRESAVIVGNVLTVESSLGVRTFVAREAS